MEGTRLNSYADVMSFHHEVTGSLNFAVIKFNDGVTIKGIVDCGMFQEKEYSDLNKKFPFKAEELDFVLITHNHVDHTGRLPLLIKEGYTKNIYMSYVTENLIPLALEDSFKVIKKLAKRNNESVLYSENDVKDVMSKIIGCKFNREIFVHPFIKVTFLNNGHLPGAALILMQIVREGYNDINILFTGDYNGKNMFFNVDPIPENIKSLPLTIVQESTYGNMDSTDIAECFSDNIIKAIKNKKTVIVPVFSLGRAQEILYILKVLQKQKKLSTGIPIYLDGNLAIKYTDLFLRGCIQIKEGMKNFLPEHLKYVDKDMRSSLLENNTTKIILTTSGMGSYGPAKTYIPEYLSRENALIQFTGYTAEDTLGYRLRTTPKGETVDFVGLVVVKRADVEYTTEFSAHAKADEMIEFLKQFSNLKLVLVNHGEFSTKEVFAERILKDVKPKNVGILGNGYFFRIDSYGLVKSLSTEFM